MAEPHVLLTGATGTLGQTLRPELAADGLTVRAASRSPPPETADEWVTLDLTDGTGLERALEGVDIVVHAATAPRGDSEAVDVRGTERLLEAAADSGVSNFVYVSIVGVDQIPYSYYEHKLAAERAIESSPVPSTIVRITQFHSFVFDLLSTIARLPVWPLPTAFQLQPIAVDEAGTALTDYVTLEPHGRCAPLGGPHVHSLGDLARAYRAEHGHWRPIIRLPLPGAVASGFRAGAATCPNRTVGTTSWNAWMATHSDKTS
ncbi:SDR family oxidoreductase [Natronolimnobius baerhuensis]|uniref:Epimerase n=1 Tax=Natronolimnobius baerhuensis TaxID=253108 RepID=A0A202EAF6_9EURY|nr:NAD(P)H-binding protein [Natronolimnobius baerhuensis]OVE85256.1 epimerase [Natronolimnobius baerhuensis]